jgi:hypothetical protein
VCVLRKVIGIWPLSYRVMVMNIYSGVTTICALLQYQVQKCFLTTFSWCSGYDFRLHLPGLLVQISLGFGVSLVYMQFGELI